MTFPTPEAAARAIAAVYPTLPPPRSDVTFASPEEARCSVEDCRRGLSPRHDGIVAPTPTSAAGGAPGA